MQNAGLFAIKHSNRKLTTEKGWGKNIFNSTFPVALTAYMESIGIDPVYLKLNERGALVKDFISATTLFGYDPQSDDIKYNFESTYTPFRSYCAGKVPKVDVMVTNRHTGKVYSGFEIKLTALPDNSTARRRESEYGCELVIRMPTIAYLACSIADLYKENNQELRRYFGNGFGNIANYTEAVQINVQLPRICSILNQIIRDNAHRQKPAIIQPVWKTKGKKAILADNCLDVFVWSELAFTKLFLKEAITTPEDITQPISRPTRAAIHLFFMLHDFAWRGNIDFEDIQKKLTYGPKNDKAFSVNGQNTFLLMQSPQLTRPRITKDQIKNIVLGEGSRLLSPERRFDATIFYSRELFPAPVPIPDLFS